MGSGRDRELKARRATRERLQGMRVAITSKPDSATLDERRRKYIENGKQMVEAQKTALETLAVGQKVKSHGAEGMVVKITSDGDVYVRFDSGGRPRKCLPSALELV